jgi:hypothetical protein
MALNILGFTIGRTPDGETVEPIKEAEKSPIVPDEYDGSYTYETGGILGTYVDFSGAVRDENALIQQYRGIALFPEVDNAIEDPPSYIEATGAHSDAGASIDVDAISAASSLNSTTLESHSQPDTSSLTTVVTVEAHTTT